MTTPEVLVHLDVKKSRENGDAVRIEDGFNDSKNGNKHPKRTTRGCDKRETASASLSTDALLMLLLIIDALEESDYCRDIAGAYLNALMRDYVSALRKGSFQKLERAKGTRKSNAHSFGHALGDTPSS